jgi:hypothetical protein
VVQEIEAVRNEVTALRDTCDSFQRLELESKKRSVLIKGLKFQTKGKFESRNETKEALKTFFDRVGVTPHLVDYQRLGSLKEGEDGSKVSIRIQFSDVDQRFGLFEKLKEKGHDLNDISILTDYPSFQMPEFKRLSDIAYKIRKESQGTKTRIIPKGLGLILQKRPVGADRWMAVSG